MTYCLGILNKAGVLGLADTRITSGSETTTAKKIYTVKRNKHAYFIMTSGLRSVRDKAITYFGEVIESSDKDFHKLYMAVNSFGEQVKRVEEEDKKNLEKSGLKFNLHAIVGGQLEGDKKPKLYLLYPQGNWIEVGAATPFISIGNSQYGTPVLKRSLHIDSSLEFALKSGFLAFDATRISANDVDYPVDTVTIRTNAYDIQEHRFEASELMPLSIFWNEKLKAAIDAVPTEALAKALHERQ